VIPMEDVVEFRSGKKVNVSKKMFPGYLLVRCHLDDASWSAIRDTPGIVNFVGAGGKPLPLSRREVENFLQVPDESAHEQTKKSRARFGFDVGETVRSRWVRSPTSPVRLLRSTRISSRSRYWSTFSAGRPRWSWSSLRSPNSDCRSGLPSCRPASRLAPRACGPRPAPRPAANAPRRERPWRRSRLPHW